MYRYRRLVKTKLVPDASNWLYDVWFCSTKANDVEHRRVRDAPDTGSD